MKIAIIKTGAVGDVLRTTSLLPGLKGRYEDLNVTWIVAKKAYDIIKTNPLIKKILTIEEMGKIDDSFDLVINLEEDVKACELASGSDRERLFGAYLEDGKVIYSDDSRDWFDMSLISRYGRDRADELKKRNKRSYQEIISTALGIKASRPVLDLKEEYKIFAEQFKESKGIRDTDLLLGINTGAGERWPHKSMGPKKTIQLIEEIRREIDAKIIVFGGSKDRERNKEIIQQTKAIDAGGDNSLLEFAGLINLCRIIITSDSLALHIATSLNKKVVVFFGPTPSSEIELYGNGIKIAPQMDCLVCFKSDCSFDPVCMDMIETRDIIDSIRKLR